MTNKRKKSTKNESLSSQNLDQKAIVPTKMTKKQIEELNERVYEAVNDLELQKSLDRWLRENTHQNQVIKRDINILKNSICEYLDSFLVLGYTMDGDRIIMQNFKTPKDRDAIVEFLKTVFLKQQHENFLDE
jgi:hypothetical protein